MAPYGDVKAFEKSIEETNERGLTIELGNGLGSSWGRTVVRERKTSVGLTGYKSLKGNAVGLPNIVNWTIMEDPVMKAGVPPYLQTAILLERRTDEVFKADINVKADVSGFSFRNLQDGLLESEDDPVIFDPGASPLIPSDLAGVNLDDLGSVDLSRLCGVQDTVHIDDIPQRRTIGQAPVEYKVESWFIDLWDNGQVADARPKLDRPLVRDDLNEYFSWISETPDVDQPATDSQESREAQQVQQQSRKTHFCNLVAMQSSVSKLTSFAKLKGLFDKLPFELLSDFFDLPPDYLISRQHDRGACRVFDKKDDEKASKLYIIQTPFYSTGFWSLLLYTMVDSNLAGGSIKLSGVIQGDAGVKRIDIFSDLFVSHYEATKEAINSIQKDVSEVDDELLKHLEEEGKLDDASKLYRKLSMTLHKCSMNLAELGRRRKFEKELGSCLQEDLKHDSKLKVLVEIYSRMSQSRDLDIESLPGKIESQRNVHDSYLQARLARESLRDSKAMKTLSILTILFLPGAFIATIFSTNMFDFKSKNQQVRVFFAIVIPLTAVLMICWVLWLKNTPQRSDEESVRQNQPAVAMNWLKGNRFYVHAKVLLSG
ncbi:hypothetical protein LZL87_008104 [Fusarium oxysporum]|nr:hypothetical protein LZL87_008104 [Fusarium oxysporum]